MTPIRGDRGNTNARSRKWLHRVAGAGIQIVQWACGLIGWRAKHVVLFIGKLRETSVLSALAAGQLDNEATRNGMTPEVYADYLMEYDDWCLSMTTPEGRWERWKDIEQQPHAIYRPKFIPIDRQHYDHAIESAAWRMISRDYDEQQLGGILINKIFRVGRKAYKRILDGSRHTTVCSGAEAVCQRWALKAIKSARIIYGGMHDERIEPARVTDFPGDYWRVGGDPTL